eukprot:6135971-Amphidinium_carterae.1
MVLRSSGLFRWQRGLRQDRRPHGRDQLHLDRSGGSEDSPVRPPGLLPCGKGEVHPPPNLQGAEAP